MRLLLDFLPRLSFLAVAAMVPALFATQASAQQRCDASTFGFSVPTSSFSDNGDGTVTDKRNGLQWMRCSVGQQWSSGDCTGQALAVPWQSAKDRADRINTTGQFFFNDWRLPNVRELAMITERQCSNPRTNLELFPNTPSGDFWTSVAKSSGGYEPDVFTIGFGNQGVSTAHPSSEKYARLVRTAQ